MTTPLPLELRKRIVERYAEGDVTYPEVADLFGVGEASVSRVLRRWREHGVLDPDPHGGGNPPRISEDEYPALMALVAEKPDRTVDELSALWNERYDAETSRSSMSRALLRAGLTRKKKHSAPRNKTEKTSSGSGKRSSKRSPR